MKISLFLILVLGSSPAFAADPLLPGTDISMPGGAVALARGDLNGDGREDLVVLQRTPALSVFLAQESEGLAAPLSVELEAVPSCLAIGHLNDDQNLDIAVGCTAARNVALYFGDGAGNLAAGLLLNASIAVSSISISDMNGDGRNDLTVNSAYGSVAVLWRSSSEWIHQMLDDNEPPPPMVIPLNLPSGAKPLDMVLIQPGTFTMGSPSDERGRRSDLEWLPHAVTITEAFYLGKYEVTQAQWEAVMGSNPAGSSSYGVGDDYPVHYVSWNDCQAFIDQLNTLGQGTFRLPTEAEWEYACRAGTDTRFSFGDALECSDSTSYCDLMDEYMWWGGNRTYGGEQDGSKEVGRKLPNPWGLHDMHGNLYEWCSDRWQSPSARGPQVDPQGPTSGSPRVLRGGSWNSYARHCRSALRSSSSPGNRSTDIGLRLLRSYP